MDYRIETKEAFQVVGKSIRISAVENDHSQLILKFWMDYGQSEEFAILNAFAGDLGLLGIMSDFNEENNEFTYMIAIQAPDDPIENDFEKLEIPISTWAMFKAAGSALEVMPILWQSIYTEWLPGSGYEQAVTPALEVYPPGDITSSDYQCEAWVPVIKI